MHVTIPQADMAGIASVLRERRRPPNPSLVASAFCAACPWRLYRADGIHDRAREHHQGTGHQVVVVETVTTTYEGAAHA